MRKRRAPRIARAARKVVLIGIAQVGFGLVVKRDFLGNFVCELEGIFKKQRVREVVCVLELCFQGWDFVRLLGFEDS